MFFGSLVISIYLVIFLGFLFCVSGLVLVSLFRKFSFLVFCVVILVGVIELIRMLLGVILWVMFLVRLIIVVLVVV